MSIRISKAGWFTVLAGLAFVGVAARVPANQDQGANQDPGAFAGGVAGAAEKVVDLVQEAGQDRRQDHFRDALHRALAVLNGNQANGGSNAAGLADVIDDAGQANGDAGGQQANGQPAAVGPVQRVTKRQLRRQFHDFLGDLAHAGLPGGRAGLGKKMERVADVLARAEKRQDRRETFKDFKQLVAHAKDVQHIKAEQAKDQAAVRHAVKDFVHDKLGKASVKHDLRKDLRRVAGNLARNQNNTGSGGQSRTGSRSTQHTAHSQHQGTGRGSVAGGMHAVHQAMAHHMAMAHQQAMAHRASQAHMAAQAGNRGGQAAGRRR
jgi:hypothetical protein